MALQKHNHAFKIQCHSKLGNEKVEDGLGSWIMNELLNISYTQNESNCRNYQLKHIVYHIPSNTAVLSYTISNYFSSRFQMYNNKSHITQYSLAVTL